MFKPISLSILLGLLAMGCDDSSSADESPADECSFDDTVAEFGFDPSASPSCGFINTASSAEERVTAQACVLDAWAMGQPATLHIQTGLDSIVDSYFVIRSTSEGLAGNLFLHSMEGGVDVLACAAFEALDACQLGALDHCIKCVAFEDVTPSACAGE